MLRRTFLASGLAVIAGGRPTYALDFTRIRSEWAFREFVTDRTLVDDFGGTLVFGGNGGLGGQRDRLRLTGGWVWDQDALCHRTAINGLEVERDCKLLYIRGDTLVMQTKRGRSNEEIWQIR